MGLAGLVVAIGFSTAAAEAAEPAVDPYWIVTLGGYGAYGPRFEGARGNRPDFRPILSWHKSDGKEWLDLPNDGFGFEIVELDWLRLGPVVDGRFQRHIDTSCVGCRHVGYVDLSVEAGAFVEAWPMEWLRARLEVRHAAIGGKGLVADLSSDVVWRPTNQWVVTGGPRLSFADHGYMQVNYGVNAAEASVLQTQTYDAQSGLRAVGLGAHVRYRFNPQWSALAYTEWRHLASAAGESPRIVEHGSAESITVGMGLSYTFTLAR